MIGLVLRNCKRADGSQSLKRTSTEMRELAMIVVLWSVGLLLLLGSLAVGVEALQAIGYPDLTNVVEADTVHRFSDTRTMTSNTQLGPILAVFCVIILVSAVIVISHSVQTTERYKRSVFERNKIYERHDAKEYLATLLGHK